VIDQAEANHSFSPNQLARDFIEEDSQRGEQVRKEVAELIWKTKRPEFFSLGVVLGYRYVDSPIIIEEVSPVPWDRSVDYTPSAAPGCLAPHQWLEDGSSLYDHFGQGFTILVLDAGAQEAAKNASRQANFLGIPFTIFEILNSNLAELYEAPLALIRPDQHIAWRGASVPSDLMSRVSGHLKA
jgi:hypothetical protein